MANILYLSLVDWFWIKQRPQHFAENLSNNHNVTYVGRRGWKSNSNVVVSHSKNNDCNIKKSRLKINFNLTVIRKRFIPKQETFKSIKYCNNKIMSNLLLQLDNKNNYDAIIITHPTQYDIIPQKFLNTKTFIYDCMDNYKCWSDCNKEKLIYNEKKIINISSSIVVSSEDLYNQLLNYNMKIKEKMYIINNGVDIENFCVNKLSKDNEVDIFKGENTNKVGYIGTISKWINLELIKNIAIKNKKLDFYIIGPVEDGTDIDQLKDIDNIKFTGAQSYYSIPNILNKLDIAIMPFKNNELVKSVNPVKIYEYLAMGKPVIALKYGETDKFGDLIYTYETKEEFQMCLDKILNNQEEKSVVNERIYFAKQNSWRERTNQIEKLIDKILNR